MSSLQRFAANYLTFTNREKGGIFGLLVLIVFIYFLPDLLLTQKDYSLEIAEFKKEIASLQNLDSSEVNTVYSDNYKEEESQIEPFYFDPNTVEPSRLSAFGWSKKLIERFSKFRNAGAKFYKKEDLKKIYGLKPETYDLMFPYIQIENLANSHQFQRDTLKAQPYVKKSLGKIDLNIADSIELLGVKGIGPYLCSKILKYRKALGGFISFEQLFEIYGIKAEQVEPLKPYLIISESKIKKISVNDADYETLNAHPYLSGKEAMAIIKYRKQHGLFQNLKDLEMIILLPKATLEKMNPYFKI
jgi:competence protein ComEA